MGKEEWTRGGGLDLITYGDNEDAIGINSQCVWVCLFLGNLYRIEQRGTYGEIKGLGESDDEREEEVGDAQYP